MKLRVAQLQESSAADRVIADDDYVVVLDGATSFVPGDVPDVGVYVDTLGNELRERLCDTTGELRRILADSIWATADQLDLLPGHSPSSTVAILRHRGTVLETLLLGDSTIVVGDVRGSYMVATDNRLAELDLPETHRYRRRLIGGSGYDDTHRDILRSLQDNQQRYRNRANGYWIAEADPVAAEHAITSIHSAADVSWSVLATDGASERIGAVGFSWDRIARSDIDDLNGLLTECHRWEAEADPDGRVAPRAKRHDDKTLVVVTP